MLFRKVDFGSPSFDEILQLRNIVLRQPLGMIFTPEQIASEYNNFHFGCYQNQRLVGTLLMKNLGRGTLKMRQVAVNPNDQSKGIGSFIVDQVEKWALHHQFSRIELAARQKAVKFYLRLHYKVIGQPFTEVGIPHRTMTKDL